MLLSSNAALYQFSHFLSITMSFIVLVIIHCQEDQFYGIRIVVTRHLFSVSCFRTHIYWHLFLVLKLLWQLFFVTCFMTIVTTTLAIIHGQAGGTEFENKKWVHVILVNNGSEEFWSKIYEVGPNIGFLQKIDFFKFWQKHKEGPLCIFSDCGQNKKYNFSANK